MDRSLDIAIWENFAHKPDLIHLSRWQLKDHQASSWLFASSKRLSPMGHSLIFFTLGEASVPLKWARRVVGPGPSQAVSQLSRCTGETQTPSKESKTRGPGHAHPYFSQNSFLQETENQAPTFICLVLPGEPIEHKAKFLMSRPLSQYVYYNIGGQPRTSGTSEKSGTHDVKENLSFHLHFACMNPPHLLECKEIHRTDISGCVAAQDSSHEGNSPGQRRIWMLFWASSRVSVTLAFVTQLRGFAGSLQ